jgi:predicted O-linked N-acetylglucosamine transferase (SPINDLY family)/glycosyltransferase involved in cell wall biosynthesis
LVSIVWYGKNRREWAEKEVDSLLQQSHSNWQLVVEDVGSTDGTREWFQRLAQHDKRIEVGSQVAATSGEALLRALRRCTGEYIAICPSHAIFLPDALEFAVHTLDRSPESGALACLGLLVDAEGEAAPVPIDLVMTLFAPLRIAPASGVLRRSALVESGLLRDDWRAGCVAFDVWCRIAMDHDIATVDRAIVDGKVQSDTADGSADLNQVVDDRLRYVEALFEEHHFFGADDLALKYECMANQLSILQEDIGHGSVRALDRHCWRLAQKFVHLASYDGRAVRSLRRWRHMWRMPDYLEVLARIFEPPHPDRAARMEKLLLFLATHVRALCWPFVRNALRARSRNFGKTVDGLRAVFADVYARQAERYIAHGQVATALRNWRLAEQIGDAMLDGTALQAEIKLPGATEASLAAAHRRWAARHAPGTADTEDGDLPRWSGRRKIRVGYHCSFMPSDTIRYMMGRVLRAHDRDQFEIYGYSPLPVPPDIADGFDVLRDTATSRDDPERVRFHNTQMISHAAFRQMLREDRVDVFVELTGFSPGHRFPAMAARCAPVQVSFLNHTASSQVPNVDYILADEISLPKSGGFEAHYSEQIYRLPGCFFCFDYRESESPPIAEPPSLAKGYVTFGCFGYGGKLNTQLLQLWAELLRQVPSSRLHIQNAQIKNERGRRFLAERFRSLGIAPERLTLAVGVGRQSLLEAYADIDISLDTWPYCGGNSIAEALWHGVPVITLKGNRFSSRYGASLVTAAGCGDLVADSPEQYVAIAKQLAGDPVRLASLRQRLRDMSIEHGLGDSAGFARRLEDAYIEMLSRRGYRPSVRTESADGEAARSKLISQPSFR